MIQNGVLTSVLGPSGDGIRGAVRGIVSLGAYDVEAFVKVIEPRELLVECVCALLAAKLNLDVPAPLLVYVPGVLSQSGTDAWAFGSVSVSEGSLRPWMVKSGVPSVLKLLQAWGSAIAAACFDEWIANPDRHVGNILFDGTNRFWLIDHGLALGKAVPVDASVANLLFGALVDGREEATLLDLRPKALGASESFAEQDCQVLFEKLLTGPWPDDEAQSISVWITTRQAHLVRLVNARIPANQGDFLFGAANDH